MARLNGGAVREAPEIRNRRAPKGEEYLNFVKLISHELGGPTAVLGGYLTMWLDGSLGELPPELRRSAEISYGKVVQLKNLINQILLAARIHDRTLEPQRTRVDLVPWLRDAARDIAFVVSSTGHALQLDVVPRSVIAEIDPELLRSALFNLVDNAQKFSPSGSAIRIRLAQDREHAEIDVVDEGLGLPEDFSLEPFARRDRHLGFEWPGVGLGVFIARGVARAHGGDLDYRTSNAGTVMRMSLPAAGTGDNNG
ncbi:MAG TPA: ATP-binding protein [Candidatus Dormibacteraeota bacterium]|nr:ATP-binding protein [Candidatus Dormibacteraeota bacterium]